MNTNTTPTAKAEANSSAPVAVVPANSGELRGGIVWQPEVPYVPGDTIHAETWKSADVGTGYAPDGGRIAGRIVAVENVAARGCSSRWQRVTVAPATSGKGYDTPAASQQVYVPAAVWQGHPAAGGGGPTVSVEEALELGAIPGTIDLVRGEAEWPQRFFAPKEETGPFQVIRTPGWVCYGEYPTRDAAQAAATAAQATDTDGSVFVHVATPRITAARIAGLPQQMFGPNPEVIATVDGVEVKLFDYYSDEISFTPEEFLGLTVEEGRALKQRKDKDYLQS